MLLVVDDNEMNRDLLTRRLKKLDYAYETAEDGRRALEMMYEKPERYDLVLLDIMMPHVNGYEVLEHLKENEVLRHIPVIMISAVSEIDSVVRCIELGAEDYLQKPFNPTLLQARIGAALEKKRLRDKEQAYLTEIKAERERAERLLLNVLPKPIADRLKCEETTIADSFTDVTVMFGDIVDFTQMTSTLSPDELIRLLNEVFTGFDRLADDHNLEKIKTIGDSYMVVGGLPTPRTDHAESVAEMALDMMDAVRDYAGQNGHSLSMRIGISSGPVIAGVIGQKKFIYDLWGNTVNMASRMESQGVPGRIQVTPDTYELLKSSYVFEERGTLTIKGKGEMPAYFLAGRS